MQAFNERLWKIDENNVDSMRVRRFEDLEIPPFVDKPTSKNIS